jgi:hypothetical protein
MTADLSRLRTTIQESLRVQRGSGDQVTYLDTGNIVADVSARQNHVIFARRGCGKTLLLHYSAKRLTPEIIAVYLNCEDFKSHSFPNVLIEILDALFAQLENHIPGWFWQKKHSKDIIKSIRKDLLKMQSEDDVLESSVNTSQTTEGGAMLSAGAKAGSDHALKGETEATVYDKQKNAVEQTFQSRKDKLKKLDVLLPKLKQQVRNFFEKSQSVKAVFLQIDDLYHLRLDDQPFVVDYVHRLCKDVPLFFKIATLQHASILYTNRSGQPIGAQERQDFQPLSIDYTFVDFQKTRDQNKKIFYGFGNLAGFKSQEIDMLFKGEGFERLVLAGGGVPRDTLSLFLEVLSNVQNSDSDKRIGKDDVRILSKSNFERRIGEMKSDSQEMDQESLIKAIYVIREFCLNKKTNVFLVRERDLQQNNIFRNLIYRLLDYRIIHRAGTTLTHKSHEGTFPGICNRHRMLCSSQKA